MTISFDGRNLLGAVAALRAALERTGDALATPRVATLLESEAGLAAALAVLSDGDAGLGDADRQRILHELALARQELDRCRHLGARLQDTMTAAMGRPGDYGPDGRRGAAAAGRGGATLQARG
jgi:hypothetical protein